MVIDRIVHSVEDEQVISVGLVELLVAHAFPDLLGIRRELVLPMGLDIALLVQAVDFVHSFWIH